MKPSLVIMAAGMGSRFGGMKQTAPVGPNGEFIIDYSVYDAVRAGFGKIVFVIRREFEQQFKETIGHRASRAAEVAYAFQELDDLPGGISVPESRVKPWGTCHAVYSARNVVNEDFAVINADDFYGLQAFEQTRAFLADNKPGDLCMAGYYIENTLTDNGYVSRGLCECDSDGYLLRVDERHNIGLRDGWLSYSDNGADFGIAARTIASMNFYGFPFKALDWFEGEIIRRLTEKGRDISTAEVYLPDVVTGIIQSGKARVKVLQTDEKWYGVTYGDDILQVRAAISNMIAEGKYSERLWNNGV